MKRPKLKKASKRLSCSKRYKIQKKVREHHKKLRKEAKKKGVKKRVKKDLGVPSSAPFKEEILREAEQRRLQIEEAKEKKREAKKEERALKRKKEKEPASKENEPKAKKKRKKDSETHASLNKNSKQFVCAKLKKVLEESDVVVEVLDARDPLGCRCPQLEEAVLQQEGNKKILLVLNKIDLVPKENVEKWLEYLQKEFPVIAFKASAQTLHSTPKNRKRRMMPSNDLLDISRGATCLGNSCLTELLTSYGAKTKGDGVLKVGVVGFPNVGKSSLINSIKGMAVCDVGINRGITKSMQEVKISKNLKLFDSPGVVASPTNPQASMALRSLQVEEGHVSTMDAVQTLLDQCEKTQIMLQYGMSDFRNCLEFTTQLAKKRGYLQKGGVPNAGLAATTFLNDWTGNKLSYHCKVPVNHCLPSYMSDTVVVDMNKDWNLSKVKTGNEETLKAAKFPNQASSISFTSEGPTEGLLNVTDISEENAGVAPSEGEMEQNEENDEPEVTPGDVDDTEELEIQEAQKTSPKKKSRVQFDSVPVDYNLSAADADDAYDFNTDFK